MFSLRRPSSAELTALLERQRSQGFSYRAVGSTRAQLPAEQVGYRDHEGTVDLGHGQTVFDRAVAGLRDWQAHHGAGVAVFPAQARLEAGVDVLLLVKTAGLFVVAACRIVYVIDEPGAFGFAYGTLPMHPEEGEEAFMIRFDDADVVRFHVAAFSRPGHPVVRLGRPAAELIQRQFTRRYLTSLQRLVRST